ncbi:PREDICTED: uncharacterized protein LOC105949748 [Erythranthe guttata]|uniref:uncharacterized protein LOC105949748 n=1 Tax=Erythranthe guttata TaxID=4155 RepID=UPI00064D767B|nr:PREDICTED: uncharacterized protein LOC105949748 [Erythranthe guttata]|eukprot:XP_012828519.1 PREDICTED: uncharacterized protein LOC105949748 [Erythranthe guttata]
MEMIFIDEQGDTVQASIKYTLLYRFESKIKVNRSYVMSNISVFFSVKTYNHALNDYRVTFEYTSTVREVEVSSIPMYSFKFTPYVDIQQASNNNEYTIYVIGSLLSIGEVQVFNHWHSSRVLINEDIPAINEFKSSLIQSKPNSGQVISQKLSQSSYSMEDDFIRKTIRKFLDELSDTNEPGKYVVLATIKGLVKTSKWCTMVALSVIDLLDRIQKCGIVTFAWLIGLLLSQLIVMDDTNSGSMIVFGKEAERMLDIPVEALIQTVQNMGEEFVEYHMELEGLIDRRMLFKIAIKGDNVVNEDHKTYNVQKVCTDDGIIASFLKYYEMDAKHDNGSSSLSINYDNDGCVFSSKDSGTCSNFNDGVVDGDITTNGIVDDDVNAINPIKRSNDCILDSILNDPTVQQSSTKLLKKIKQEKME